jgi:hypothetical protein
MRIPSAACAAMLFLLSGCAAGSASRKHAQEGSYARYSQGGSGSADTIEPATGGGGCRPLMAPLVEAFDTDHWGSFGNDDWERNANKRHSCWNRVWEVPTAIVAYPVAAVIMVGLVTSPIWLPLLLLL